MSPSLVALPAEILVNIALDTALLDFLGPPRYLVDLLCTCSQIHAVLSCNADLFARIFKAKFDTTAPKRRVGPQALHSRNLAAQLVRQCIAMKRIRNGDMLADTVENDFWTTYLMLLENDGRNAAQLDEYAHLGNFVDRFVRLRLAEDKLATGWPRESPINALSLWLLWMTTDNERLRSESQPAAQELIDIVLPYVYGSFRYPAFHASDIHFRLPFSPQLSTLPRSIETAHGAYPLYPSTINSPSRLPFYGGIVRLGVPLLVNAAQLVYFQRRSTAPLGVPANLAATRTEAIELARAHDLEYPAGYIGPTGADYLEFNSRVHTGSFDRGDKEWRWLDGLSEMEREMEVSGEQSAYLKAPSARWDSEWDRLTGCWDMWGVKDVDVGRPWESGSTSGLWVGKMLMPQETQYFVTMQDPFLPANFSEMNPWMGLRLLYMRLREHQSVSPAEPIPCGGERGTFDDGVRDGWFPRGKFVEEGGTVKFTDLKTEKAHVYETYRRDGKSSHSEEDCLLCLEKRREEELAFERERERIAHGWNDSEDDEDDENESDNEENDDNAYFEEDDVDDEEDIEVPMDVDDLDGGNDFETEDEPDTPEPIPLLVPERDTPDVELNPNADLPPYIIAAFQEAFEWNDQETQLLEWECSGFQDLIVTGETDRRHGEAWGHYRFFGRMRLFDGLLAIVAVPSDQRTQGNLGKWIFRGYIFGGRTFTGKWRHHAYDVDVPPWEGAFVACKQPEDDDEVGISGSSGSSSAAPLLRRRCSWGV